MLKCNYCVRMSMQKMVEATTRVFPSCPFCFQLCRIKMYLNMCPSPYSFKQIIITFPAAG